MQKPTREQILINILQLCMTGLGMGGIYVLEKEERTAPPYIG